MNNRFVLLCLLILIVPYLFAGELEQKLWFSLSGAYYPPNLAGHDNNLAFIPPDYGTVDTPVGLPPIDNDRGRQFGNGWGGAKLEADIYHRLIIPFLTGNSALTKDNSLTINSAFYLSPVTVSLREEIVWTPIAFFLLRLGEEISAGWNIGIANGLGLNNRGDGKITDTTFNALLFDSWLTATLQFDLAAVYPGDWNHFLLVGGLTFRHYYNTAASVDAAWLFQADAGENFNGWLLEQSYFIGHRPPHRVIDTYGIQVELNSRISHNNLAPLETGGWGSDFLTIIISPLINLNLSSNQTLTILLQLANERRYQNPSGFYNYYANRRYKNSYFYLYRLAFSYSLQLF